MSKQSFADQAERQTILTELDQNFFVEAGAGSGKTTSLVGRIIALIKTGTCSIAEIAAITFTRKAAGELKERLQIEIEQSLGDAADRQVTERLQSAINQLDQCYVGTIHSFCFTILRERPVEAGLDPAFQSIEGIEERLLERKAWDNFIQDQYLYQRQNIDELAQIDIDPRDLFDAYRTLNLYPDVNKAKTSAPYPAIGDELQRMLAFAHDARLNILARNLIKVGTICRTR